MALKATFTAGSDTTTVTGLHQWDYGQELEIEASDLGSEIVEIHFACSKMEEAIVRSCSFVNSIGTVVIPDVCLEQSSPITAWIYQIRGTWGHTIKTITMPITARTRPNVNRDIPAIISDKYTELITEINETVEDLENGTVTVAKAIDAQNASHATSASNAGTANFATTAGIAQYASADTTKGTIDERLEIIASKDAVLYAQNAGHADTATAADTADYSESAGHSDTSGRSNTAGRSDTSGHADTAGSSETASSADKLKTGIVYLSLSSAKTFTPSQRAYVFTFTRSNSEGYATVTLLARSTQTGYQYSTQSAFGEYMSYNKEGSPSKLRFYDHTGMPYDPTSVNYREI